ERKEKNLDKDDAYTYGEVTFYSFIHILEAAKPQVAETFYDLGSGAGKAVFIAALVFPFTKACGVEKLSGLYQLSCSLLDKLQNKSGYQQLVRHREVNIQFIHGDLLEQDISDGDIIFINATAFDGLFDQLIIKLHTLKKGSRIILTSATLDEVGGFELMYA